ncbi:MAG: hypothetical protein ABWK01_04020 [Infirmifilum sp.]
MSRSWFVILTLLLFFPLVGAGVAPTTRLDENLQQGPFLVINVFPSMLNLTVGGTGTARLIIYNYGSSPAYNATLTLIGPETVNFTYDGVKWGRNLTLSFKAIPQGQQLPVTLFVKLLKPQNATIAVTLLSDNADPSISAIHIRAVQAGGGAAQTPINYYVAAGIVIILVAFAFYVAKRFTKKPSKSRQKRR